MNEYVNERFSAYSNTFVMCIVDLLFRENPNQIITRKEALVVSSSSACDFEEKKKKRRKNTEKEGRVGLGKQ